MVFQLSITHLQYSDNTLAILALNNLQIVGEESRYCTLDQAKTVKQSAQ